MLAFAAVLITAGSLGDLFGRKRLFLAGITVFGLASLGAGLARSPGELIAARVVQGAAAAVMTPQLLATFRTMFSGPERGQAFGLYGAVLGFASAVGWDPREINGDWVFFRLTPARIQAYRGYDELEGRDVMLAGRWLA